MGWGSLERNVGWLHDTGFFTEVTELTLQLVHDWFRGLEFAVSILPEVLHESIGSLWILPNSGRYHISIFILDPNRLDTADSSLLEILLNVIAGVSQDGFDLGVVHQVEIEHAKDEQGIEIAFS